ncbi:MAG: hypothetical protein CHACPFDD_02963 [Phycisphaerae bacterium]|nr:hypothetical protein [Phycisphaerae bacterium]
MLTLMTIAASGILGQAPAADAAKSAVRVTSVWDFVVKGGPIMVPIGICSLIALAVIVERAISLRRVRIIPPGFLAGLREHMRVDRRRALDHCEKDGSPIAAIVAEGIRRLGEPVELLEKHITEAGEREIFKLRRYLRLLSVVASVSTLLGLLGTILGMITAFQTVAASGEALGKTELLAKGIYEALITTAAGLMVAIPVIIAYHGLSSRVEHLVAEMDRLTVDFIDEFARPKGVTHESATPHDALVARPLTGEQRAETPPGLPVPA